MIRALAAALLASALLAPSAGLACQYIMPVEPYAYVGGDLPTQLARKAVILQVVRVTSMVRTPDGRTKFTLTPVDTLKGHVAAKKIVARLEVSANARNGEPSRWERSLKEAGGVLNVPAPGRVLALRGESSGCEIDLPLALGQWLVAARDLDGGLYGMGYRDLSRAKLMLDVSYSGQRSKIEAPALIPVAGPTDPIVLRLKRAIAAQK